MDMPNENQNPLFAYAEARIAAWQAVLASLKNALSLDPSGQTIEGIDIPTAAQNNEPIDLPEGAYNGKSLPQCVKLYLSAAKRKKTIKDIATALREGGVESTSPNFEGVVNGALFRLKATGEVLRFKDGWGLPEWYPANIRSSAPASAKRSKSKKKAKKSKSEPAPKAEAKTEKAEQKSAKVTEIPNPQEKTEPRVMSFLRANHREASAEAIATALGLKIQTTHLILGKLTHKRLIQKLESGHFKLAAG